MLATEDDSMREYAINAGRDAPNIAWILTPYDVWMRNPYYRGPKVQHPEYDDANFSTENESQDNRTEQS